MTPSPVMQSVFNGGVRVLLITLCAGLAIGIPKLGLFISLIGECGHLSYGSADKLPGRN